MDRWQGKGDIVKFPEQFRYSNPSLGPYQSNAGDTFGMFVIHALDAPKRRRLCIVATDGYVSKDEDTGWEHVSVSLDNDGRIPSWEEMCFVKELFWDDTDCVVQFHPAKQDYVNVKNNCLHLWRARNQQFPMPPRICV